MRNDDRKRWGSMSLIWAALRYRVFFLVFCSFMKNCLFDRQLLSPYSVPVPRRDFGKARWQERWYYMCSFGVKRMWRICIWATLLGLICAGVCRWKCPVCCRERGIWDTASSCRWTPPNTSSCVEYISFSPASDCGAARKLKMPWA